jgi:hypothetical protein
MTAARHPRKLQIVPLLCLTLAALGGWSVLPGLAGTTERIVVDAHSGLAINGFDPVAYFTDSAALMGRSTFEASFANVTWRFRNEGNRAAFLDHPEIYTPHFGGYDPVAVARGVGVAGNPRYWLVSGKRLYLFYTEESRALFVAGEAELSATADREWPKVQFTLSP